jgi:TonB family protein
MLAVLLESNAVLQRRNGGAAMSVATHLAIVGFVAAVTAKAPVRRPQVDPITPVHIAPPIVRPSTNLPKANAGTKTPCLCVPVRSLPVFETIPPSLPPIDLGATADPGAADLPIGTAQRGIGRLGAADLGEGGNGADGARDWTGSETLMHLLASERPRYPERMRTTGISGRVRIRFVVDTTGRVDPSSVQVIESTHDLFTNAVRAVLPSLRFKPSEANGQRVRSLAEMPFDFVITR